ncbi:nucleotidyltransferase family protein [Halalkalicoccus jeotgali]|uniref:Molybdopterin-guanine dinucleotide biosynthesis protein A n=1 Tax=Halalkalicoccus jeotgali (strain DSM 18796 / CECT 7217 / JCM 14584 / KCTC 4019 / B3) TaxID=795797 RepID=D8JBA4_HALJB|nr:nucleotidyltransferase family protein [Halalkalicoccus jeotgali]ADJ16557.1 molybdopterin-guanine dinucleotide biosynthesis protein A [Halalkalicoccus jeotgali B3]ELY41347.1 molybdopterin-guanine dinucleotide biosynthesis protein A [Halalkalicoccus jeotgali B3]
MTGEDPPSYDTEELSDTLETDPRADPDVVGVVLAGGTSSRFGEANKLLADVDGESLVRHATRTLLRADLSAVVVVVGYEAESVRAVLSDLDVRVVTNPDYEDGLSTTVTTGLRAVGSADAVVFLPGDMPSVDPTTVEHLIDAYRAGVGTAIAAAYDGHRGNPVLFDRTHFDALRAVEGDVGGRPVFVASDDSALIDVPDPGVLMDIDTLEDLQ